jgi:hypothetical protein
MLCVKYLRHGRRDVLEKTRAMAREYDDGLTTNTVQTRTALIARMNEILPTNQLYGALFESIAKVCCTYITDFYDRRWLGAGLPAHFSEAEI